MFQCSIIEKSQQIYFVEIDKVILKLCMEIQKTYNIQSNLEKEEDGELTLTEFRLSIKLQ